MVRCEFFYVHRIDQTFWLLSLVDRKKFFIWEKKERIFEVQEEIEADGETRDKSRQCDWSNFASGIVPSD